MHPWRKIGTYAASWLKPLWFRAVRIFDLRNSQQLKIMTKRYNIFWIVLTYRCNCEGPHWMGWMNMDGGRRCFPEESVLVWTPRDRNKPKDCGACRISSGQLRRRLVMCIHLMGLFNVAYYVNYSNCRASRISLTYFDIFGEASHDSRYTRV